MKNLIITCSDSKNGDFVADHWLVSLRLNCDLSQIDVVVIDYGLNVAQRQKLNGVYLYEGIKNHHIVCARYLDVSNYLEMNMYDQVMIVDGGDIIFQDDFRELFENDKSEIKAVAENYYVDFRFFFMKKNFYKNHCDQIRRIVFKEGMINAGVLVGPYKKIKKLCSDVYNMIKKKNVFGPDQVAVNYLLYRDGFKLLSSKYNFIPVSSNKRFCIRNGKFYFLNQELIPIVHNAGNIELFRTIRNFGYGKNNNIIKPAIFLLLRGSYRVSRRIFS